MGIRTVMNFDELEYIAEKFNLVLESYEETSDGISDTTYILRDINKKKYILKVYENKSLYTIEAEIKLLNRISILKQVPKPYGNVKDIIDYKNKFVFLFSYIDGESVQIANSNQIAQVAKFLGNMHQLTNKQKTYLQNLYSKNNLLKMISNIRINFLDESFVFKNMFDSLSCINIEDNYIIHGDLFPDNAKFEDNRLTGVFDFIENCNGDHRFDLAVIGISWIDYNDFNQTKIQRILTDSLLATYNEIAKDKVSYSDLINFMLYASLFYATQRFHTKYIEQRGVDVKDYNEYIEKFNLILKLKEEIL